MAWPQGMWCPLPVRSGPVQDAATWGLGSPPGPSPEPRIQVLEVPASFCYYWCPGVSQLEGQHPEDGNLSRDPQTQLWAEEPPLRPHRCMCH